MDILERIFIRMMELIILIVSKSYMDRIVCTGKEKMDEGIINWWNGND